MSFDNSRLTAWTDPEFANAKHATDEGGSTTMVSNGMIDEKMFKISL